MAFQNLTHWLALDIFFIIVTCKLAIGREQDNGFLQKQTFNPASRARAVQNGGLPMDDSMLRYFLYYMAQMSNKGVTNQRQPSGYDRGVKRIGSEFLGKRSPGVNSWSAWKRDEEVDGQLMPHDKRLGSEFIGKRLGSEFLGKRMGSEFVGKRLGSEFIGKRLGSEFLGKRRGSEFVGKRSNSELAENFAASEDSESGNSADWNFRFGNLNKNHSEGLD